MKRFFAFCLGFAVLVDLCQADEFDARMVHILVVADTNDPQIGEHVKKDRGTVVDALETAIPGHRRTIRVLEGGEATAENILAYYDRLKVGAADSLFFYYAGHGAVDEKGGHVLTLRAKGLSRDTLLRKIKVQQTRLSVVITDCCTVYSKVPEYYAAPGTDPVTLRYLLFRHRGIVDLTAADLGSLAYGSNNGGVFTNALFNSLKLDRAKLDPNRDGVISWSELWQVTQESVKTDFARLIARDKRLNSVATTVRGQVPHAFSKLAEPIGRALPKPRERFGVRAVDASAGGARVVEIVDYSPADWFGVRPGDRIVSINDDALANRTALEEYLREVPESWPFPLKFGIKREGTDEEESLLIMLAD